MEAAQNTEKQNKNWDPVKAMKVVMEQHDPSICPSQRRDKTRDEKDLDRVEAELKELRQRMTATT